MAALYDQLTQEQQEYLREYIRLEVKQDILTTGAIEILPNDRRQLTDVHAQFVTNGVEPGDTVQFYQTTPASIKPVGSFDVTAVEDENTIEFSGDAIPLGVHTKYRIINTSPIQRKINDNYLALSTVINIDKAEALWLEALNTPWFNATTVAALHYFIERTGLDGYRFFRPVVQQDLDNVTLVPRPLLPSPEDVVGPLLYPYQYGRITPDRRYYVPQPTAPLPGSGTPPLLGLPDVQPPAIPSYNYGSHSGPDVPIDAGELPAILEEVDFYASYSPNTTPPPYFDGDDDDRLDSIRDAQEDALNRQIYAIDVLISILDTELADLRERGVTSTGLHTVLSVARGRLTVARANAVFARDDATYGLPAITLSGPPTIDRENFLVTRQSQISARLAQIPYDQSLWIQMRYVMLNRRVNPLDGSLTLLRYADARISELSEIITALLEERSTINYPLGVNNE